MFFLDTNVVIFSLNGRKPELANRVDTEIWQGTPLFLSAVVLFELEYGIAKSTKPMHSRMLLDAFLGEQFEHVPFTAEDAAEAGNIRAYLEANGTPIGPYDLLIAAQVRRRGATLVTLNRREFGRVPNLTVTDWSS